MIAGAPGPSATWGGAAVIAEGLIVDPRFKLQVVPGEGLYALSETHGTLFRGRLYEELADLLERRLSTKAVVDALAGRHEPARVYYALQRLRRSSVVMTAASGRGARVPWWRELGYEPDAAESQLERRRVRIVDFGAGTGANSDTSTAGDLLADSLNLEGIAIERGSSRFPESGSPEDLVVVLTPDYLLPQLGQVNLASVAAGRPWLLARPVGREVWIGPTFIPGQTGCWECLAQRLRGNRPLADYLVQRAGWAYPESVAAPGPAVAARLAANMIALVVLRQVGAPRPEGESTGEVTQPAAMVTFDISTGATGRHVLVRRPQCPACGTIPPVDRLPRVELPRTPLAAGQDGGWRAVSAQATVDRFGHHVSHITGAVSILTKVSVDHEDGLHVYLAGQNMAVRSADLAGLRVGLRSASGGKGVSDTQAKASALCEALERYSGRWRGDEARVRASFAEASLTAIHPNACSLYSEAQYAAADEWNAKGSLFASVPRPFDESAVIDWTPVTSLITGEMRYLPSEYCFYGDSTSPSAPYLRADSNGCAAGNTLTEAVLQGFLELVERDAVAVWWYNRLRRPSVDLMSFDEPYIVTMLASCERMGRDLWALDLTHDFGVPVFVAVSRRTGLGVMSGLDSGEGIHMGFGAHLDPSVALMRALTELTQMLSRPVAASGAADDVMDRVEHDWMRHARVDAHPYLSPDPGQPARSLADFPAYRRPDDLLDAVQHCRNIVAGKGLDMLVLDQTRPDIGLPVAKVFVPGLRHFWARLAPGRLYDVPVQLGWSTEPLTEDQLNPVPMFL